jgi:hypothetical protein
MRWIALVIGLLFGASDEVLASGAKRFGWTLSASPTDPFANTGPASADTLAL